MAKKMKKKPHFSQKKITLISKDVVECYGCVNDIYVCNEKDFLAIYRKLLNKILAQYMAKIALNLNQFYAHGNI